MDGLEPSTTGVSTVKVPRLEAYFGAGQEFATSPERIRFSLEVKKGDFRLRHTSQR